MPGPDDFELDDFEPDFVEEPVSRNYLSDAWNWLNTPITRAPSDWMRSISEPLMSYGESDTGLLNKGALYGGAYLQSLADVASGLTSPANVALTATTGGALGAARAANTARMAGNIPKAIELTKLAQRAEMPGRVAAGGMIGQGLYKIGTEEETSDKLAGGVEAALGGLGLRSMIRNPIRMDVLDAPPKNRPLLPTNAGPSSHGGVTRFIGGEAGIAENRPYNFDMSSPLPGDMMSGSGTVLPTELGGLTKIPPTLAARQGLNFGKPSLQFDNEFPNGLFGKSVTDDFTPDVTTETVIPDEPQASLMEPQGAKTAGGIKIGADVTSLGKVLGSSLYQGDIAKISTKELLQNSLDAVRPLGPAGKVDVTLNAKDRFVEVDDNGPGLTLKEIETVFTDLGSSGKRGDENAIGGFGLAKAAPLLGGERVEVQSIVRESDGQLYQHTFSGTPDELLSGVQVHSVRLEGPHTTGTMVRTYVPDGTPFYEAEKFVENMSANSSNVPGKIKVKSISRWGSKNEDVEYNPSTAFEGADITTITDNPIADFDIIIPKGTPYGPSSGVRYQIVNQGMWQGEGQYGWKEVPGIPKKLILNVRSKVPEGHIDYPFTANREKIRGKIEEIVHKYLDENIVTPAVGRRVEQLSAVYNGMPEMVIPTASPRKFVTYDVGGRFEPSELNAVVNNETMQFLGADIADVLNGAMTTLQNPAWNDKLEKIGFIFDEGLKGIHIPNPKTGKSAILINPFSLMVSNTPDQASAGMLHTILHEIAHIHGGGHDEDFTIRLSEIYDKYGAGQAIESQHKFLQTISGGNREDYTPEVYELLQKYITARGRESIKDDPLRGTGIGSEAKRDRTKKVPLNSGQSRDTANAVSKLINAIKEAAPIREEQEGLYTLARGARAKAAKKVKEGGETGFYKQLSKMRGPMEHLEGPNIRQQLEQPDIDALFDTITNSQLDFWQQLTAKRGLAKLLGEYGGHVPQNTELKMMAKAFGPEATNAITELFGGLGIPPGTNFRNVVAETANTMKSMMASIDAGFLLRQGLPLAARKEFYRSINDALQALSSEKGFETVQQMIEERPKFAMGEAAGLHFTDVSSASTREEAYMSNWAEKVLGLGPIIKRTSRMHTAFLNSLRARVFDNMVDDAMKIGAIKPADMLMLNDPNVTKKFKTEATQNIMKVAQDIAKFANVSTGRGSLGRLEKVAVELNNLFFSPRLLSSRLTMLNPNYYVKLHPMVRKEALKSLFTVAGATTMFVELLRQNGATVSNDPNSADFRKIRVGNTRIDPYGGFQQEIVAAARTLKAIQEGEDATTITMNFMENKLSPFASLVNELAKGKRSFPPGGLGQAVTNNKPGAHIINRFTPMIMGDLIDLANEDPNTLPLAGLGSIGMGLQTYKDSNRQRGFTGFRGFSGH